MAVLRFGGAMLLAPHASAYVTGLDLMAASSSAGCGARSAGVRAEALWRGSGLGSVWGSGRVGFGATGVDIGAVRSGLGGGVGGRGQEVRFGCEA